MMNAAFTPSYGPSTIIETREVPVPTIDPNQVLVRVHAAPVTAGDRRLRAADFPGFTALLGRLMIGIRRPRHPVQGTMFAGRIVQVGDAVTDYAVGDDVFGSADHGAYAEYIAVSAAGPLAKMPAGLSYAEAAEVPYGAVTALRFLRDLGDVKPGDEVLIVGASGGVGRYAVQIAKHLGARVTGVCSARNAQLVRDLGADDVLDYAKTDFTRAGRRYDVVFDIADATSFRRSRPALTETGRYLTLYISARVLFQMLWTRFGRGQKALFGVALGDREDMAQLRGMLDAGAIRPTAARRFPFARITEAHAEAESGRAQGGVVVTMAPAVEPVGEQLAA